MLLLLAAMALSVPFIDGKSSENTTESVSSLSFSTIGVAPPAWLVKDAIILERLLFPTPNEFPFGFVLF